LHGRRRLGVRSPGGACRRPRLDVVCRHRRGRRLPPVRTRRKGLPPVMLDLDTLVRRRARRRRRRLPWRTLAALVVLVCALGIGPALGEALHDNPEPGGTTTTRRTLKPVPLAPARETVTVTVTGKG